MKLQIGAISVLTDNINRSDERMSPHSLKLLPNDHNIRPNFIHFCGVHKK